MADCVEDRVAILDDDLAKTKALLRKTHVALVSYVGKDIDGDVKMG